MSLSICLAVLLFYTLCRPSRHKMFSLTLTIYSNQWTLKLNDRNTKNKQRIWMKMIFSFHFTCVLISIFLHTFLFCLLLDRAVCNFACALFSLVLFLLFHFRFVSFTFINNLLCAKLRLRFYVWKGQAESESKRARERNMKNKFVFHHVFFFFALNRRHDESEVGNDTRHTTR